MDLIQFVLVLVAVGVIMWLVNSKIPMDATIKNILNIAVVIAVVLWILRIFGILDFAHNIRVGR